MPAPKLRQEAILKIKEALTLQVTLVAFENQTLFWIFFFKGYVEHLNSF